MRARRYHDVALAICGRRGPRRAPWRRSEAAAAEPKGRRPRPRAASAGPPRAGTALSGRCAHTAGRNEELLHEFGDGHCRQCHPEGGAAIAHMQAVHTSARPGAQPGASPKFNTTGKRIATLCGNIGAWACVVDIRAMLLMATVGSGRMGTGPHPRWPGCVWTHVFSKPKPSGTPPKLKFMSCQGGKPVAST